MHNVVFVISLIFVHTVVYLCILVLSSIAVKLEVNQMIFFLLFCFTFFSFHFFLVCDDDQFEFCTLLMMS
jgi:hypothetical protein